MNDDQKYYYQQMQKANGPWPYVSFQVHGPDDISNFLTINGDSLRAFNQFVRVQNLKAYRAAFQPERMTIVNIRELIQDGDTDTALSLLDDLLK